MLGRLIENVFSCSAAAVVRTEELLVLSYYNLAVSPYMTLAGTLNFLFIVQLQKHVQTLRLVELRLVRLREGLARLSHIARLWHFRPLLTLEINP